MRVLYIGVLIPTGVFITNPTVTPSKINVSSTNGTITHSTANGFTALVVRYLVPMIVAKMACKRCTSDSDPQKTEEPNDIFTPAEYGADAEEEKEGCSRM